MARALDKILKGFKKTIGQLARFEEESLGKVKANEDEITSLRYTSLTLHQEIGKAKRIQEKLSELVS